MREAAAELLERYRGQDNAALAHAGWLDLLGRCWACVVAGPDWVDVCLVSGNDDASAVQTLRMEVDEWRRAYAQAQR